MMKNSYESNELSQLRKILSNNGKNGPCCEYLEVTVGFQNDAHPSLIMKRVSHNEYHGYAQWFRKAFRPKVDEKPDLRNSSGTIFWKIFENSVTTA